MTEAEQNIIMEMISSAGESKVKSFEALKKDKDERV
ncbi:cellobiose-specific phosphotransferase system component IIA [Clostridium beijerinckii]|nr:PTS lactose/cellobiose transporter subunit IIA [Clostridium beijerinckii]NRZ59376.1 cellobiose-specific phosphotransferase system component IIA [Clostridium beijerinckii]